MATVSPLNVWTIILNIGLVLVDAEDVIIVGAGMSGISAGRHLLNQGGFNVTILEARPDRYGGRMWTNKQALPNAIGLLDLLNYDIFKTATGDGFKMDVVWMSLVYCTRT